MAEFKQRIVSCPNGHYYDANAHDSCPICAGMGFDNAPGFGGFAEGSFEATIAPGAGDGGYFSATLPPDGVGGAAPDFGPTIPPDNMSDAGYGNVGAPVGNFSVTQPPKFSEGIGRFSETISVDGAAAAGQPSPVVGWFVAISGPCRGTDYRIHANYNYIGREVGDICVHGDQAISAQRDSSIAYVSRTKRFYIAHEQGLNTVLVNDEPVMGGGRELKNYDVVTIGSTQFVFVALCGPMFDWDGGVLYND